MIETTNGHGHAAVEKLGDDVGTMKDQTYVYHHHQSTLYCALRGTYISYARISVESEVGKSMESKAGQQNPTQDSRIADRASYLFCTVKLAAGIQIPIAPCPRGDHPPLPRASFWSNMYLIFLFLRGEATRLDRFSHCIPAPKQKLKISVEPPTCSSDGIKLPGRLNIEVPFRLGSFETRSWERKKIRD